MLESDIQTVNALCRRKLEREMDKLTSSLSREDWIDFALKRLTEEGVEKIGITSLANGLSVTKGSFYWHFRDRNDLREAMLARWETDWSERSIEEVERIGGDAVRRIKHLSDIVFRRFGEQLKLELALRGWSRKDPKIWAAIRRQDELRIGYLQKLFFEIFKDPVVAETKAWLLFSLFVGESMITAPKNQVSREDLLWAFLNTVLEGKE